MEYLVGRIVQFDRDLLTGRIKDSKNVRYDFHSSPDNALPLKICKSMASNDIVLLTVYNNRVIKLQIIKELDV